MNGRLGCCNRAGQRGQLKRPAHTEPRRLAKEQTMYANILIPTDGSELPGKAAFGARSLMAFPESTIQIALASHEVHSPIM